MPAPRKGEKRKDFLSRCMGDAEARKTFPNSKQRYAFCNSQWDRKDNLKSAVKHNDCGCGCNGKKGDHAYSAHRVKLNFDTSSIKHMSYEGRDTLVVPVIMIKAGVVMNQALVSVDEIVPDSWNGVPVTVSHPMEGNSSANKPEILTEYHVGRIFNAELVDADLKAEAWIDVERAETVLPGLVEALETGVDIDVSTGYLAKDVPQKGTSRGRAYNVLHTDIKPDHLALLINEVGACSWQDGCGVRANRRKGMKKNVKDAFVTVAQALGLAANERGENPDDRRLVIADLISDDNSPFLPDDEESLRMMSNDTLLRMRDDYIGAPGEEGDDAQPANNRANRKDNMSKDNSPGSGKKLATLAKNAADFVDLGYPEEEAKKLASAIAPPTAEEQAAAAAAAAKTNSKDGNDELPKTKGELTTLIANALKEAANTGSFLSVEDRAALDRARQIGKDHRSSLIEKIVANTAIKKEDAEKMELGTLEVVANGIPVASFNGRHVPDLNINSGETDEVAAGMVPPSLGEAMKANASAGGSKKEAA